MRYLLLLAAFCFFSFAVEAKGPAKVESEKLPPVGAPAPSKDDKKEAVTEEAPITPEQQASLICQTATMMGAQIKSAEYVAGVDAYGNPVAPADAYSQPEFEIPEAVEVPIAVDVMAALGVTNPAVEGKATIGTLTVLKGGKLLYNGKDITNSVEGYCREHVQKEKQGKKQ